MFYCRLHHASMHFYTQSKYFFKTSLMSGSSRMSAGRLGTLGREPRTFQAWKALFFIKHFYLYLMRYMTRLLSCYWESVLAVHRFVKTGNKKLCQVPDKSSVHQYLSAVSLGVSCLLEGFSCGCYPGQNWVCLII